MPIGRAALESLRLKLQAMQADVRKAVVAEQEEVLQARGLLLGRCSGCCACSSWLLQTCAARRCGASDAWPAERSAVRARLAGSRSCHTNC